MLSLVRHLPWSVRCGQHDYRVNFAFDNVLRWYQLLEDKKMSDGDKGIVAWQMFVNVDSVSPTQRIETLEKIFDFVQAQPYHDSESTDANDSAQGPNPEKYFSYSQDAGAIWSSVMATYGIDLEQQMGKLHWLKFRALIDGLPDQSHFQRIINIRRRSRANIEGEELTNLVELQDYYMLDEYRTVDHQNQMMADFFNAWASTVTKPN